jgi:hypothetical protein
VVAVGQTVGSDAAFDAVDALGFATMLRILLSHVFASLFCGLALPGEANRQSRRAGNRRRGSLRSYRGCNV